LRPEDIVVKKFSINMGMKAKNPMENVGFYRAKEPNTLIQKKPSEISLMMPEKC